MCLLRAECSKPCKAKLDQPSYALEFANRRAGELKPHFLATRCCYVLLRGPGDDDTSTASSSSLSAARIPAPSCVSQCRPTPGPPRLVVDIESRASSSLP
mmetsp:Transcript_3756/g.12243  ORF Transcript_3756/g.12243 Transcript_3756/m.12243 type:complete len:100 (-) Transcript_3756:22-321(-)